MNKKYLIVKRIAIPILCLAMWFPSVAKNIGLSFEALASNVGNETIVIEQVQMPPAEDSYANLLALGQTDLGVPTGTQQGTTELKGVAELDTFPEFRKYMDTLFGTVTVGGEKRGQLYTAWGRNKLRELIEIDGNTDVAYYTVINRPTMQNLINAYRPQLIEAAKMTFSDITGDEWFAGIISMPVYYGVISGMGDGTFQGNAYLTREQAAAMMALTTNARTTIGPDEGSYITNGISDWARPFWHEVATWMTPIDLLEGDQSALYQGYMPRGEFCYLLANELFRSELMELTSVPPSPFSDLQTKQSSADVNKMLDAYVPEAKIVLDSAANGVCPSRWFTSITFLYSKGILTGYPDGTVGWNSPLTRAEALTLIEKAVFAYVRE